MNITWTLSKRLFLWRDRLLQLLSLININEYTRCRYEFFISLYIHINHYAALSTKPFRSHNFLITFIIILYTISSSYYFIIMIFFFSTIDIPVDLKFNC